MITPEGAEKRNYSKAPTAYKRKKNEWLLVPRHHIFGSDELSLQSSALAERVPKPYVVVNSDDAVSLGVGSGDEVELAVAGGLLRLQVKLEDLLPPGVVAVPVGLPGLGFLDLSAPARIAKVAP